MHDPKDSLAWPPQNKHKTSHGGACHIPPMALAAVACLPDSLCLIETPRALNPESQTLDPGTLDPTPWAPPAAAPGTPAGTGGSPPPPTTTPPGSARPEWPAARGGLGAAGSAAGPAAAAAAGEPTATQPRCLHAHVCVAVIAVVCGAPVRVVGLCTRCGCVCAFPWCAWAEPSAGVTKVPGTKSPAEIGFW